jgi:hypothetical protein
MFLKRDGSKGDGKQQKHKTENNQACALNGFGIAVALPEECVHTPSALSRIFPKDVLLSRFNIGTQFFEIPGFFHAAPLARR